MGGVLCTVGFEPNGAKPTTVTRKLRNEETVEEEMRECVIERIGESEHMCQTTS